MSAVDPGRSDIIAFMATASQALGRELAAPKDVFAFGGTNPRVTDELLQLAVEGKKTATTSWPIPQPLHWGLGGLVGHPQRQRRACGRHAAVVVRRVQVQGRG